MLKEFTNKIKDITVYRVSQSQPTKHRWRYSWFKPYLNNCMGVGSLSNTPIELQGVNKNFTRNQRINSNFLTFLATEA